MMNETPLAALNARVAAVNDVLNATSVLTWDSRTMMPRRWRGDARAADRHAHACCP